MGLSFIKPNKKSILSTLAYSWFLCFLASSIVLGLFWLLLDIQTDHFVQNSKDFEQKISHQRSIQNDLAKQLSFLDAQLQELQNIKQENTSLIEAIRNLFNLIPEQITINSVSLTDKNLTLKGITPSKELYVFLLEAPLKAIFNDSKVDFFVLPSGWYNFVSVNSINNLSIKANNDQ